MLVKIPDDGVVLGPVPSRRSGKALGIDTLHCNGGYTKWGHLAKASPPCPPICLKA